LAYPGVKFVQFVLISWLKASHQALNLANMLPFFMIGTISLVHKICSIL
jgi:hypothetical protein